MSKYITPITQGASQLFESKDCVVRAAANALNIPYEKSHSVMKTYGRTEKTGCSPSTVIRAFSSLGLKMVAVCGTTIAARHFAMMEEQINNRTVKQLPGICLENFLKTYNKGTYVCLKRGHVFAVIDGNVIDSGAMKANTYIAAFWKV